MRTRVHYWLGKTLSTRQESPANVEAIRRCLATIPPARLVETLEATVAGGTLERDGVWL